MVGRESRDENTILFKKKFIILSLGFYCLVASRVLFISNLETVLEILIIFQFFSSGEDSGKTFLKKVMKMLQTKKTYMLVQLSFVLLHLY